MYILSADDIRHSVSMAQAVDAVADAFVQLSTGRAIVPLRTSIPQTAHSSHSFFMPALLSGGTQSQAALGLKIVSVFPHNAERRPAPIHRHHAPHHVTCSITGQKDRRSLDFFQLGPTA